jgi:hypothetical protein
VYVVIGHAATVAAAALLAYRRFDPSIGGRCVGSSPLPKPVTPLVQTLPDLPASSAAMARLPPKMMSAAPSSPNPSSKPWTISSVSAIEASDDEEEDEYELPPPPP